MRRTVSRGNSAVYFEAENVRVDQRNSIYEFNLDKANAGILIVESRRFAGRRDRRQLAIAMPAIIPGHARTRGTLSNTDPPAYEVRAAASYMRGSAARIQGGRNSFNLVMSKLGAKELAGLLEREIKRARRYVEIRASRGSARRDPIVEVIADTQATVRATERADMGLSGAALAKDVWPTEDFSDWEAPHAG